MKTCTDNIPQKKNSFKEPNKLFLKDKLQLAHNEG